MSLKSVATETKNTLDKLANSAKSTEGVWHKNLPFANFHSIKYDSKNPVPRLDPTNCPKFKLPPSMDGEYEGFEYGTRVEVINADTFEAAISLSQDLKGNDPFVAVLNLGNPDNPGGGWLGGAQAQEEHLFYRSTLCLTLDKKHYPIHEACGIYSPVVSIIRKSVEQKHVWYVNMADEAHHVAVLTVAATSGPRTCTKAETSKDDYVPDGQYFADPDEADLLREKIRIVLRMAAYHGHSRIVLGALGCGVFAGPKEAVAEMFYHVFMEEEFSGGWFENIVFAVKERKETSGFGKNNFDVFWKKLNGLVV